MHRGAAGTILAGIILAASCSGALDVGRDCPNGCGGIPGSCGVPSSVAWSSAGPLISPISGWTGVKDPTAVFFNDRWHVYATNTEADGGFNISYLSFSDWSQAESAPRTNMAGTPIGGGRAAPQLFYFAPQRKWYLIYEWPDVYSTNSGDPSQTANWTRPATFYPTEPAIVTENKGSGGWIDFWVVCNDTTCFLFFTDRNGHLYRAQTPIGSFPNGFDTPVIIMSDASVGRLLVGTCVYSMKNTGKYLLMVEAFDADSAGRRYYRSWTASALDGAWTPLQAEFDTAFASTKNVTFSGAAWTEDISQGEILRSGYDQKMEIDTCKLRFLFGGKDPSAPADLEWRLGVLTQTN